MFLDTERKFSSERIMKTIPFGKVTKTKLYNLSKKQKFNKLNLPRPMLKQRYI